MSRPFASAVLALALCAGAAGACDRPAQDRPAQAAQVAAAPAIVLTGRVVDDAQILSPETEAQLDARFAELEQAAGPQLVAVTVKSLQGRDVDTFSLDLARAWRVGDARRNDGVLLLVAPSERKARIEVGTGLATTLTNARCDEIMQRDMLPRFRAGEMAGGIAAGADSLIALLRQHPTRQPPIEDPRS